MILKVFSIIDIKADAYGTPWFAPTVGMAVRNFSDAINDARTGFSRHPSDYKLVCLGSFDDNSGRFFDDGAQSIGFGSDFVTRPGGTLSAVGAPDAEA